jgi:signal peptidase I
MEPTGPLGEEAAARQVPAGSERWVAGRVVALLCGPLGHIAVGQWRRACAWYAAVIVAASGGFFAAWRESPRSFWLALAALVLIRVAVVADVWRLPRLHPLPRPRLVVLVGVGVVIFYEILGVRVRTNFVEAFSIPSGSMYPTIETGDQVYVKKEKRPFQRGEVVVFRYPLDPSVDYVKRIIGVGGDVVGSHGGQLVVNGQPVERRQLDEPCEDDVGTGGCRLWEESSEGRRWHVASDESPAPDFGPVVVPAGSYFVVGDNRDASSDSRVWGPVSAELVKGSVTFIWWSRGEHGVRWDRINAPVR